MLTLFFGLIEWLLWDEDSTKYFDKEYRFPKPAVGLSFVRIIFPKCTYFFECFFLFGGSRHCRFLGRMAYD